MEAYFMGIDTGTQGVRIGISDTRGKLIFEKEQKWETEFPKVGTESVELVGSCQRNF